MFESLLFWPFLRHDVSYIVNNDNGSQFAYKVNALWGERSPILHLTEEDQIYGNEMLQQLGVPSNAWFVCVHAREGGFSPIDEEIHRHRNGKVSHLIPSIEAIIRRGGWVIRIGDPSTMPLKAMPQMIDYAHHALRNPRMDIVLCARAKFILGNTSGICLVGSIFGTPCAMVNMIPFPTHGFLLKDLSIPKLFRCKKQHHYLSFAEVMNSDISTFRYSSLYEKSNIIIEENSPEDILLVTTEMLDRLENHFIETQDSLKLYSKYLSYLQPRHYSYGANTKISFNFLDKYRFLFI
jgi:putative glycosyltransferase (TIGR04372 family)